MISNGKGQDALGKLLFLVTVFTIHQIGLSMKSMKSMMSGAGSETGEALKAYETQMYTEVGFYKGNLVAIKKVMKETVQLTRQDLLELKAVSLGRTMDSFEIYDLGGG